MSRTLVRSLLAVIAAFALLTSACGSSTATDVDTAAVADASDASNDVDESISNDDTADSSDDSGAPVSTSEGESPIADLLGVPLGDDDAMEEYFGELQRQAERKVTECMIAQGFEYKSFDFSQFNAGAASIDEDTREFAEMYGFGISSNPFDELFESVGDFVDPNAEYVQSLTPGEAEAYQTALNGELPDGDPSDTDFSFEPAGCQGEAYEEAFAFAGVFEEFSDEIEEAEQAFEADPRIVTARSGWAGCMADGGFTYNEEEDARSDFERRYGTIVEAPGAYEETDLETVDPDAGTQLFEPPNLTAGAQAQVDTLADQERAVAVASWDCNEPLREIEDAVQREYEQNFVDQHGAAIRGMLDE